MNQRRRLGAAWPVAAAALIIVYIACNPPLTAATVHLIPLGLGLVFAMAFIGWGTLPVLALARWTATTDRVLIAAVFGAGLSGAFTFLPGVLGFVHPVPYAVWVVAGLILAAVTVRRLLAGRVPATLHFEPVTVLAVGIIGLNLIQLMPMLLSPVVSTDAMEYHLMIPKIALATGKIAPLPSLVESSYPGLMSFIYLMVLPLAGDITCKVVHFLAGVGVLFAIGRLVERVDAGSGRWLAPALFLTMPVAAIIFGWAWNDLFFVLCLLLGIGQLADFHEEPSAPQGWKRLVSAGVLLGLAAWTKYTIVMILAALAPLFIAAVLFRGWKFKHLMILATPIGLISLLVFVKNAVFMGNPFYPFLHTLFPTPTWTDQTALFFHDALRRWEIPVWHWHTPVSFILPMVLKPRLIDIHTGIMPLLALPFLWFRSRTRPESFLKWFALLFLLSWYLFRTETRSLLTLFAVVFALAAPRIERALENGSVRRWAAVGVLSVAALVSLTITGISGWVMTEPFQYLIGTESREAFLRREVPAFGALDWINRNDQVNGAVLVGLKRPYYAEKPVWFSAFADIPIAEVLTRGTTGPDDLARKLAVLGATHIVIDHDEWEADHRDGLYSWSPERRAVFEAVVRRHSRTVASMNNISIYELMVRQ